MLMICLLTIVGAVWFIFDDAAQGSAAAALLRMSNGLGLRTTNGLNLLHSLERHAAIVLLALLVLALECWALGYRRSSLSRVLHGASPSTRRDLGIWLLIVTGAWPFLTLLYTCGAARLLDHAGKAVGATFEAHHFRIHTGSMIVNLVLFVLLQSFCEYWSHRLFHQRPFWSLHRIHHSATEMSVLNLWRGHPASSAVESMLLLWPLLLLDVGPGASLLISACFVGNGYLQHADLPWHWGWFGRWVLLPPAAHRLHHALDAANRPVNFGNLVLWDRLFGTYAGSGTGAEPIGLREPSAQHPLLREWIVDLVDLLRSGVLVVRTWLPKRELLQDR